ncbi:hypothetical protein DL345_21730 [Citrobacter koseri]|nr:hypothetical protein DL345_21730 [Citrobacter koseri]
MVSPGVILFGPVLMAKTERYRSDAITVGRGIAKKIFPLFVLKWNTEKFITFHSGTITPKKRQDCDPDPFSLLIMPLKKRESRVVFATDCRQNRKIFFCPANFSA